MRTGIIDALAIGDYHADHALSKSGIKFLLDEEKTPEHFFYNFRNPLAKKRKSSPDHIFGQAFHDLELEPEIFATKYIEWKLPKTGNRWKMAKAAAESDGKVILDAADFDALGEMDARITAHPEAKFLLPKINKAATAETSFFWNDPITGIRCKCRTDILIPAEKIIVPDIKTCRSASKAAFEWDVFNYGYDIQDAAYTSGVDLLLPGQVEDFIFLCIEKEPPYCIALHRLSPYYKRLGYMRYRRGVEIVAECEKSGSFPGFPTAAQDLDPPRSLMKRYGLDEQQEEDENDEPEEYSQVA